MQETMNLEKVLEEAQETPVEETPKVETPAEETPKEETPKEETPPEEKDAFADLTEITELNKQFVTTPDGKRVKVTDLIDGNMRQEDYTQKTMELAEARHQVSLAAASAKAPEVKDEKKAAIDLTEQNKAITAALAEMDENDPMGIVLKGLVAQNNQVIEFINNQSVANAEAAASSTAAQDATNAQKLISEAMEREAKNYNLPVIKGTDGEESKIRDLWDQIVLTELRNTNENLTLTQFNHRVSQIGQKAYKQLRTIISAATANKPKEETAASKETPQKKETKVSKETEDTTKADKNKGLPLKDRMDNFFDSRSK